MKKWIEIEIDRQEPLNNKNTVLWYKGYQVVIINKKNYTFVNILKNKKTVTEISFYQNENEYQIRNIVFNLIDIID